MIILVLQKTCIIQLTRNLLQVNGNDTKYYICQNPTNEYMCKVTARNTRKNCLTHLVPVLPSYRNQSIDLHSKSIDWFLYEGNTGT